METRKKDDSEDFRREKPDYEQNQKTPRATPNIRYYNFSNRF